MTLLLPEFSVIHINSSYSLVNIYNSYKYIKSKWPCFTRTEMKIQVFTNIFKGTNNFEMLFVFVRDIKLL